MASVMRTLTTHEYNKIGDYLYYRLNPIDLPNGKVNDIPAPLVEMAYDWKTKYMQILWQRKRDNGK